MATEKKKCHPPELVLTSTFPLLLYLVGVVAPNSVRSKETGTRAGATAKESPRSAFCLPRELIIACSTLLMSSNAGL